MRTRTHAVQKFLHLVAVALFGSCGVNLAFAQSVPMLVQAESMTLVAPMTAGYDIAAMGGRFISQASGTPPPSPTRSASVQVNVPAGTYFLWARIAGPSEASDALYVGIDSSFARIFPQAQGPYEWVKVPTADGGANFGFSLGGTHTIQVSTGEIGAKLDAVYLTNSATDTPSFTAPQRLAIEAEALTLTAPMTVGSEAAANGGQFISPTSGTDSTTPVREASIAVDVPAGSYHLWARIAGPTDTSDALYLGIDSSFARSFPISATGGAYEWVKVATTDGGSSFGFTLTAGTHVLQVGHGEIGARLDGVYLTNDANDVPTLAPMRRVIEAESMTLTSPMTVGVENDANGAQFISPTSGTNSTVPVREASTTITVPATGTYFLWARIKGLTDDSDALYVGFDNSWDRIFPSATGAYEWVRVETADGSGTFGFALTAGPHDIQVGHGEIGARLDAVYVTNDANDSPAGSTPAGFPAACALPSGGYQGFGRNTTGGTGQPVYHVTSLADPGVAGTQGTLRDALSQGNRCVVFDVGGLIELADELHVKGSNVTIDGFTAPAPGITIRFPPTDTRDLAALVIYGGEPVSVCDNPQSSRSNVIVRGIRVRGSHDDGISIYNATNVVIDRVSVSAFGDGAVDVTKCSRNVTIQWSILGDGDPVINFVNLIGIGATRVSSHHNLYIRGRDRQPYCGKNIGDATPSAELVCDTRNNLVWDYKQAGTEARSSGTANVIRNYYKAGAGADPAQTIHIDSGGVAFTRENFSQDGYNVSNGNTSTEFPVDPADVPTNTDAHTAALAVKAGAGARGPNFGLDSTDQDFINSVSIP